MRNFSCLVAACILLAGSCVSGVHAQARKGTIERIKVHGKSLEGNLGGDSPDRDVSIYLPPSYQTDTSRRYPVVYMLHGFTDSDAQWFGHVKHWINLPEHLDQAYADPGLKEVIVVMPNAFTRFFGSMYSNSAVNGNWEQFVADELVAYIDGHYRTIPDRASRGLAGHSMGGYGTLRIGMKRPDVFSSIYLLSACCMITDPNMSAAAPMIAKVEQIKEYETLQKADFLTKAMFASAAAWSPNPKNPPFYLDLPTKDGQIQPAVLQKWAANAPLASIDQYVYNLRSLKAIAFDAGTKDASIHAASINLDQVLTSYDIPHTWESYEGDHLNRVAERIRTRVLPFFGQNLSFETSK